MKTLCQKKSYTFSIFCFVLIISCLSLRFFRIKADPPRAFDHAFSDEGRKIFNARNMALFGKPTLGKQTPWGILYTPVFTGIYYTVFKISKVSIKTARVFSICVCCLTVLLFYCIVHVPCGKQPDNAALLATLLFASDFPYFVYSRLALPEVLCIFMLTMSILMYKKLQNKPAVFHVLFGAFITILPMTKPNLFPYVLAFFVLELVNKKHIPFLIGICFVPSILCFFLFVSGREKELTMLYKSFQFNTSIIYSKRHIYSLLRLLKRNPINFLTTLFRWVSGFVAEHPGGSMFIFPFLWLRKNYALKTGDGSEIYRITYILFCVVTLSICYTFLSFSVRKWYMLPLMPLLYIMGAYVIRSLFEHHDSPLEQYNGMTIFYVSAGIWLFLLSIKPIIHMKRTFVDIAFMDYSLDIPLFSASVSAFMSFVLGKYAWWWKIRYSVLALILCGVFSGFLVFFRKSILKSVSKHSKVYLNVFIGVLLLLHFGINAARYLKWVGTARNYTYNAAKRIDSILPEDSIICGASFLSLESKNRMLYRGFSIDDFEKAQYFLIDEQNNCERFSAYLKEITLFPFMGKRIYKLFYLKKKPKGRMKGVLYRFMYSQTL